MAKAETPEVELQSFECYAECTDQRITVPTGSYDVYGVLAFDDGKGEKTIKSAVRRVEIDSTPLTAAHVPGTTTIELSREPGPESVTDQAVQLIRTAQLGPTRTSVAETAIPVVVSIEGKRLNLAATFQSPARYTVKLKGVRDLIGNEIDQSVTFDRYYLNNGPDLHQLDSLSIERLAFDDQRRLHHLYRDAPKQRSVVARLNGSDWVEVATLPFTSGQLVGIDREGAGLAFQIGASITILRSTGGAAWTPVGSSARAALRLRLALTPRTGQW